MVGFGGEQKLAEAVMLSPLAGVITNPRLADNPIVVANPAFCELTGYSEADILGRNCRFLAGADTESWVTEQIRDAVQGQRAVLVDILNYRRDGSPFRNGVMVTPLFDESGDLAYFLGSQVDLGDNAAYSFALRRERARFLIRGLPERQRQVLELMAKGLLNKQIAHRLGIAEKTVKMHRALLLDRLGAATTADAIRIAVEAGF